MGEVPLQRSLVALSGPPASLIRNCTPLGPYGRPMPRSLCKSYGGGVFLRERDPCTWRSMAAHPASLPVILHRVTSLIRNSAPL